jgi:hypothetical protein
VIDDVGHDESLVSIKNNKSFAHQKMNFSVEENSFQTHYANRVTNMTTKSNEASSLRNGPAYSQV